MSELEQTTNREAALFQRLTSEFNHYVATFPECFSDTRKERFYNNIRELITTFHKALDKAKECNDISETRLYGILDSLR